jgi:hypothetical protein
LTGTFGKLTIDFHSIKRMIAIGDGVRLITAVLLAGQMMTPDKFLVAESCPGNEPTIFIDFFSAGVCGIEIFNVCAIR